MVLETINQFFITRPLWVMFGIDCMLIYVLYWVIFTLPRVTGEWLDNKIQ